MSTLFDARLIMDRLTAEVPALQQVEGAAAYAAISSLRDFRTPSAYVLLAREEDADPEAPGHGRQRALVKFGVVIAVGNYRDLRGGAEAADELRPVVGAVRAALMGWQPPVQGARPIRWLQGDVLDYDASVLLWAEVYQTQQFIGG